MISYEFLNLVTDFIWFLLVSNEFIKCWFVIWCRMTVFVDVELIWFINDFVWLQTMFKDFLKCHMISKDFIRFVWISNEYIWFHMSYYGCAWFHMISNHCNVSMGCVFKSFIRFNTIYMMSCDLFLRFHKITYDVNRFGKIGFNSFLMISHDVIWYHYIMLLIAHDVAWFRMILHRFVWCGFFRIH